MLTREDIIKKYVTRLVLCLIALAGSAVYALKLGMTDTVLAVLTVVIMLSVLYEVYLWFVLVAVLIPKTRNCLLNSLPFDVYLYIKEEDNDIKELQEMIAAIKNRNNKSQEEYTWVSLKQQSHLIQQEVCTHA